MNRDYLQKYYFYERNHWWFLVRKKILLQQLKHSISNKENIKILNAGAATGGTTQMLQQFGEVVSVEIDTETCVFLQEKLGLDVVNSSLEKLPFEDNSFDVVCVFDVIEHIDEQDQAIMELSRVCKKNGLLYCSVPAFSFLWSRHDEVNHHKRRYTKKSIISVVSDKFSVEYCTYFNFLLFPLIWMSRVFLKGKPASEKMVSDFESNKILNGTFFSFLFKHIFSIEILLLRFFTLPFGVSILLRARK